MEFNQLKSRFLFRLEPVWQRVAAFLRHYVTHHRLLLFIVGMATLLVIIAFALPPRRQPTFSPPSLATPDSSPTPATFTTTEPQLVELEASAAAVRATLQTQTVLNHPLLPPSLDVRVTLEQ